jgi:hypothetical protein
LIEYEYHYYSTGLIAKIYLKESYEEQSQKLENAEVDNVRLISRIQEVSDENSQLTSMIEEKDNHIVSSIPFRLTNVYHFIPFMKKVLMCLFSG